MTGGEVMGPHFNMGVEDGMVELGALGHCCRLQSGGPSRVPACGGLSHLERRLQSLHCTSNS